MKILLALCLAFLSFSAKASPWVEVTADRQNLLYLEGERANFLLRQMRYPSDPAFSLEVSVISGGGEDLIDMPHRTGIYQSIPLTEGTTEFLFRTKLKGPGGWEKILEETEIEVRVGAGE